jgi:hypothetical protein
MRTNSRYEHSANRDGSSLQRVWCITHTKSWTCSMMDWLYLGADIIGDTVLLAFYYVP